MKLNAKGIGRPARRITGTNRRSGSHFLFSSHTVRLTSSVGSLFMVASRASAQATSDMATVYSGIAFSVASLVVIILVGVLVRRFGQRRKNDLAESSGLDLMNLRKKNLLTPEEMKMVSQAIARRMAEREQKQKSTGTVSTATLLHDPEVQRLQELARIQKEQTRRELETAAPNAAAAPAPTAPEGLSAADVAAPAGDTPAPADDLADVELPPEVQQLADAGILTAEEIENVKRRLRARQ